MTNGYWNCLHEATDPSKTRGSGSWLLLSLATGTGYWNWLLELLLSLATGTSYWNCS